LLSRIGGTSIWWGNFNMVKDDTVRKAAIGEECAQAVDLRFKALTFFVVCDGDAVEV